MPSASRQHSLDRVRRPRVQITYDVEINGATRKIELPFVIGVLADLSGQSQNAPPPLKERRFVPIDRDNFNDVLKKMAPREEYDQLGGEPYGMLVADYEFSRTLDDINMLKLLSGLAAMAHAPLITAASAKLFNMESFTELSAPRDPSKIFQGVEYMAWRSFRDSEDSRYVALTMPRVLGRLSYGQDFRRIDEFNYEEDVDGRHHDPSSCSPPTPPRTRSRGCVPTRTRGPTRPDWRRPSRPICSRCSSPLCCAA